MALTSKPLSTARTIAPEVAAELKKTEVRIEDPARVNIIISKRQRDAWKIQAVNRNMTVTDMILASVEEFINNHPV
ncbi:hypothetical protein [Actimicrobium sp. CCI2.3]|jgi:NhaP-type Na+/H+ and K+/H+ antiporter|uniref:hypothetical protein n=1 Tax=Actimicrobium sp. CCI2.3 TaxID=3048616 RepID=UPI002B248AAA|nr:hypothetical protein [Actimicrobium sp. CCI2.3]MEB0023793.1 hypothetical protein [Actimicrobium sp. CCI2.3]